MTGTTPVGKGSELILWSTFELKLPQPASFAKSKLPRSAQQSPDMYRFEPFPPMQQPFPGESPAARKPWHSASAALQNGRKGWQCRLSVHGFGRLWWFATASIHRNRSFVELPSLSQFS